MGDQRPLGKQRFDALFILLFVLFTGVALAQEPEKPEKVTKPASNGPAYDPNDVVLVPRYLIYLASTGALAVWGTLSTVVAKLYYGRDEDRKQGLAAIEALKREHQTTIDALKRDCQAEIKDVRDRLEQEKDERLKEQERLLREQKDIFKEVMATLPSLHHALDNNTKALDKIMGG